MYFPENNLERFIVTFEGQEESWVGPYAEAASENQRFKHLGNECVICLEDFLPTDQVIVFPCTHGLHEHCFKPCDRQECPLDRKPTEGISKAHFLGYSILFPSKTCKFGIWLSTHKDMINAKLQESLIKMSEKDPEEFQKFFTDPKTQRETQALATIVQAVFQDLLNAYDGSLLPADMLEHITAILETMQNLSEDEIDVKEFAKKMDINTDLTAFAQLVQMNSERLNEFLPNITFLTLICAHITGLTLDAAGVSQVALYLQQLLHAATADPQCAELADHLDRRFLKHHFKAIDALTPGGSCLNPWGEVYSYLNKLEQSALQRLGRLVNQRQDPLSEEIKMNIARIDNNQKVFQSIKKAALTCGILACAATCIW